ncbi:MAG TPA: cytochrome c peroxidase, partial [Polyangiaceae bacterium]|nr:cytochrome c peroxidase [Polyangiaceae bacterium]
MALNPTYRGAARRGLTVCALALAPVACGGEGSVPDAGAAGAGGGSGAPNGGADSGMNAGDAAIPNDPSALKRELSPALLPAARRDVSNRYADDPRAATFGQRLFYDPAFAGKLLDLDNDGGPDATGLRGASGKVSCASCHEAEHGFSDTRSAFKEISLGTGWTNRRTPSLLDVGQATLVMWGGRHSTLHAQVFGPIENPLEMNSSRLFVAERIAAAYRGQYEELFGAGTLQALADGSRFPLLTAATTGCHLTAALDHPRAQPPDPLYECHGIPGDGAEYDSMTGADQELVTRVVVNAGKAIAAFQRRLECGQSRFDTWVHGDANALTAAEQRGFDLFVGKGRCVSCHSGPFFSDQKF